MHVQRRVRVVPRAMAGGGGGGGGLIPLVLIVLILFTPVGKAILDLSALLFFAPLVLLPLGFLGLQFWAKQNVVTGDCPVCGSNVSGVKNQDFPCLSCGTVLTTESDGTFRRKNPTFDPSGSQSASSPFSSSGSPGGSASQANASSASSRTGGPAQEPGTGRKTWKGGGKAAPAVRRSTSTRTSLTYEEADFLSCCTPKSIASLLASSFLLSNIFK